MDPTVVYVKTKAGQEEIAQRKHKLAPRLRTLLIMVDGRTTLAEHTQKAKAFGDAQAMLAELASLGLIAPLGASGSGAANPAQGVTPPATIERSIAAAKRYAVQQLIALLGPDGDPFAERVEAAKDRASLETELSRCRAALSAISGAQKAERFWAQVLQRMPD